MRWLRWLIESICRSNLLNFSSTTERLLRIDVAVRTPRHPLLEFVRLMCPASDLTRRVYSHPLLPAGFGQPSSRSVRPVPSLWFCTTSTVYSAFGGSAIGLMAARFSSAGCWAYCIPVPDRVRRVSRYVATPLGVFRRSQSDEPDAALSHSAVHTLRRSPLPDSRSASPRSLPPCRCAAVHSRIV
jgi:hypothetical protein